MDIEDSSPPALSFFFFLILPSWSIKDGVQHRLRLILFLAKFFKPRLVSSSFELRAERPLVDSFQFVMAWLNVSCWGTRLKAGLSRERIFFSFTPWRFSQYNGSGFGNLLVDHNQPLAKYSARWHLKWRAEFEEAGWWITQMRSPKQPPYHPDDWYQPSCFFCAEVIGVFYTIEPWSIVPARPSAFRPRT